MQLSKRVLASAAAVALPLASAITPEGMLAAPRRGDAVPNPTGEFAVFTSTNYSWTDHEATTVWNVLNLTTGDISVWTEDSSISEVAFVGDSPSSILYVNGTNEEGDGGISLYTADAFDLASAKLVGSIPAPLSGLKAAQTSSGDINFLLYGFAYPNGTAYNEETAEEALSTARIYSDIYVRHWDYYLSAQRNAVFGGSISGGSFSGELTNFVTGLCNATCAESPVQPFGGSGDYDISPDGSKVVFLTKNIDLPLANYTSSQIYLVPFAGTVDEALPLNPIGGDTPAEAQGASATPIFSHDGTKVAYVQMSGISYESDRNILYVANADVTNPNVTALAGNWDRSPDTLAWSEDDSTIYAAAADRGEQPVFVIPLTAGADFQPKNITARGVPVGMHVLSNDTLLVSDSKIWSSRDIYTVSTTSGEVLDVFLQANLVDEALAGLGPDQVDQFYFDTNSTEIQLQSWIIKPTGFDPAKKYPLAFITHGGPQGAHFNSWSTRWNFKVWADQGYVVIAPNPTASTGWGQNLTDAVASHWGDYPYWDLVHAWQYVNNTLDYVDTENGIEAGASFGGFMTNWMQGHEMGRWFKALVTHDGVTNKLSDYASEELWFMNHDNGGAFTSPNTTSPYYQFNPVLYYENWQTPHFVVHNDLDYRLPVSEGIMLFNLLQVKGVPSKFLNFPDENHWVQKRENSIVWHNEIFKWINYYSGISNATSPY